MLKLILKQNAGTHGKDGTPPMSKLTTSTRNENDPLQLVQQMYRSPIPETSNVHYVENHIAIGVPHTVVFEYVTTWANLPKWLPVAKHVYVRKGELNALAKLGDVLREGVHHEEGVSAVTTRADKIYTVVLKVAGSFGAWQVWTM